MVAEVFGTWVLKLLTCALELIGGVSGFISVDSFSGCFFSYSFMIPRGAWVAIVYCLC